MSFYSEIANYYDAIFPFNSTQLDFIKSCTRKPYKHKTILDIGCGTGDLAIALSNIGFHVTGIDYDVKMLHKARKKTHKPVSFVGMDMKRITGHFSIPFFDIVLCFGNTLVHLTSLSEIESFCKQIKMILRDNGTFLFQILNYDHILDHNIKSLPLIENDTIAFERYYEYNSKDNLMKFRTILTIKETGKRIENEIFLYPLRKHELDEALKKACFTDISYYADFDKSKLKADSLPLVGKAKLLKHKK